MSSLETNILEAQRLLPAWFIPHMMREISTYGLMLANGHVIAINQIHVARQGGDGSIWIDVTLAPADDYWDGLYDPAIFGAPTSRRDASINASHIAAAFELVNPSGKEQHP